MQREKFYTLTEWRIDPDREQEFVVAWKQLADEFNRLEDKPEWGTLIRSADEPGLLFSFGPWPEHENIMAMQREDRVKEAYRRVRELCTSTASGVFAVLAEIEY